MMYLAFPKYIMSNTTEIFFNIVLGTGQAGKSLEAIILDRDGNQATAAIRTGFTEIGTGNYTWSHNFPGGFLGSVVFRVIASPSVQAVAQVEAPDIELSGDIPAAPRTVSDFTSIGQRNDSRLIESPLTGKPKAYLAAVTAKVTPLKATDDPSVLEADKPAVTSAAVATPTYPSPTRGQAKLYTNSETVGKKAYLPAVTSRNV